MDGQNKGNVWAHQRGTTLGTMSLDPKGSISMRGQRYPITEIGLLNMARRMIEVVERDIQHDGCEVQVFDGAKSNQRACTVIQVTHPKPRRHFTYYLARIFVDDQLHLPVRSQAFDWPEQAGGQPQLIEECTFLDLKLKNGFTDTNFSVIKPEYRFPAARR